MKTGTEKKKIKRRRRTKLADLNLALIQIE